MYPLIVLEGGDGSGKATQATLLQERCRDTGAAVSVFDFPRYEQSYAGKLVGECLAGKHANFRHLSPHLASLPFTLDRAGARDEIAQARSQGVVMCNRYTSSNIAYQAAKLLPADRDAFIAFLEALEYEELGIPRPDLVVYLDVPTHIASELISQKHARGYLAETGETKDQHERDTAYQDAVAEVYRELAGQRADWQVVTCTDTSGELRSRDAIHADVWKIAAPLMQHSA